MMQPEDKTQEIAERAERLQEIGSSILRAARDELYLGMRFLDVALSSFSYQMDGQIHGFGTDGRVMYFQPQMLGGLYRENRILVNRGYLHMVFHCIFRHFAWRGAEGRKRADDEITIQERMRDLSCDIAVEHMIDGMNYRSIRFSRSLLRICHICDGQHAAKLCRRLLHNLLCRFLLPHGDHLTSRLTDSGLVCCNLLQTVT